MHLALGPRLVCRTSQNGLSGAGQRTWLQSTGGCSWREIHRGLIYCLQLGLFLGQVVGTTVFMQVRRAGHGI